MGNAISPANFKSAAIEDDLSPEYQYSKNPILLSMKLSCSQENILSYTLLYAY